ncbi:hypothetical protein FSARC_6744 [Fusarium sarcochroum]|uniref:Uncharacterized protein n=1 Tax=Fusarium sarcochroum TaxID=1208366 RepID=A0A8H4TWQ9_9HYPO|nr:hypothetical protein FSARC_6744 [Fusarium sarcochroum]
MAPLPVAFPQALPPPPPAAAPIATATPPESITAKFHIWWQGVVFWFTDPSKERTRWTVGGIAGAILVTIIILVLLFLFIKSKTALKGLQANQEEPKEEPPKEGPPPAE